MQVAASSQPDIARFAALLADGSRAAMLSALLGGRALTASELARSARITPQTASAHLRRLESGGLITCERQGRHRYYALSGKHVARMLEALALLSPPAEIRSLRASTAAKTLAEARTCYDHLAGRLGVALADRMLACGWLAEQDSRWTLTPAGRDGLAAFGLDLPRLGRSRRPLLRRCLDWSERRPHIAGALGMAIAQRCLELGWFTRAQAGRALRVTAAGREGLMRVFGLDVDAR